MARRKGKIKGGSDREQPQREPNHRQDSTQSDSHHQEPLRTRSQSSDPETEKPPSTSSLGAPPAPDKTTGLEKPGASTMQVWSPVFAGVLLLILIGLIAGQLTGIIHLGPVEITEPPSRENRANDDVPAEPSGQDEDNEAAIAIAVALTQTAAVMDELPSTQSDEQPSVTESEPTDVPEPTNTPVPTNRPNCRVINDYSLIGRSQITSSGSHIHIEYYFQGQPEYETLVYGGQWTFSSQPTGGWVWEYADCTDDQVMEQINAHIQRRQSGGANNGGFISWQDTGLFP